MKFSPTKVNYLLLRKEWFRNDNRIISDIETPSFGYEKKLIIAKNTGILKKEGRKKNAELAK